MLEFIKETNIKNGSHYALYKCDCGNIKEIRMYNVKNGKQKSCGCKEGKYIHRMTKSDEFNIWQGIRARCYNKNVKGYKNYGGRGIQMCERWRNSFKNFLEDMGNRPSKEYSIERKNNNKDYYKENCYWATIKEQCRNRRSNRIIEFKDQKKLLIDWSHLLNISYSTLSSRLRSGWSIEETLTIPVRKRNNG